MVIVTVLSVSQDLKRHGLSEVAIIFFVKNLKTMITCYNVQLRYILAYGTEDAYFMIEFDIHPITAGNHALRTSLPDEEPRLMATSMKGMWRG